MNFFLKDKIFFLVLIIIVILLLPLLLDVLVFNNSFVSKVSNDGWAGFLGGYIGAIIGALTTLIAIKMEMNFNLSEKAKDEVKAIRPFLSCEKISFVTCANGLDISLTLKNVGYHAACDITIYSYDQETDTPKRIHDKHTIIGMSENAELNFKINYDETEFYFIEFLDIGGNRYSQRILFPYKTDGIIKYPEYCYTSEPEMVETRKERDLRLYPKEKS